MDNPILPPLLNGTCTDEPFATAIERVRWRKSGAGDLFWSKREDIATLAIILEPEVSHTRSLEMLTLAMVALSDCLAVLLPPQVAVQFRNCNEITVNGGVAGNIKAAIAMTETETDIPDWIVLEITVGLIRRDGEPEPGTQPDITTLDEEGCEDCSLNRFIETFSRHFLSWLISWNDDGFTNVSRAWKFKAEDKSDPDLEAFQRIITNFESAL